MHCSIELTQLVALGQTEQTLVHGLELLEALLDHGLALVGPQHLRGGELAVVAPQRIHAVAATVVGDGVFVEGPLHGQAPLGDLEVSGVAALATTSGLLEHGLFAHDAADLEATRGVVLVRQQLNVQVDLGGPTQPRLGGVQALALTLEIPQRSGVVAQPPGVLAQRGQGAPDPDDELGPLGGAGLDLFAELGIFEPAAGHDGDEAAARAVDVIDAFGEIKF